MSKTSVVPSTSGPNLRGLHHMQTKRHLFTAIVLTALVTVSFKMLVNNPRKEAYAEFYKHYDAEKSFERMRANGHFQSC